MDKDNNKTMKAKTKKRKEKKAKICSLAHQWIVIRSEVAAYKFSIQFQCKKCPTDYYVEGRPPVKGLLENIQQRLLSA